jgi:putative heme transporter
VGTGSRSDRCARRPHARSPLRSRGRSTTRKIVIRAGLLLLAGLSIYLLAPQLIAVFSSYRELKHIDPWWLLLAVGFEVLSYVALWTLQRIALRTRSWFSVATAQLAAGAAGSVVPGGGAAATALQYNILVRAGVPRPTVASGLTASWAATTATAFSLSVIGLLCALGGTAAPRGLRNVAYIGAGGFLAAAAIGAAALHWDAPLRLVGRAVRSVAGWFGKGARFDGLPERLLVQRDAVKRAFASHPWLAGLAAFGKWGFDYLALLCVLAALGARPEPALVLLAYAAASLLAMIPLTPGGLGFVEAGLTGMLVLAGVGAQTAAVATLAYRLVSFWLPLPVGLVAYLVARRRYGASAATTSSATSELSTSPP